MSLCSQVDNAEDDGSTETEVKSEKNMSAEKIRANYRRWWVGKRCRPRNSTGPFRLVRDLIIQGSNSLMVCVVTLVYDDGEKELASMGVNAYRPRKSDVEVEGEK